MDLDKSETASSIFLESEMIDYVILKPSLPNLLDWFWEDHMFIDYFFNNFPCAPLYFKINKMLN